MRRNVAILFFLFSVTVSVYAHAHGKHAHGRHVHGEAEMHVVLHGTELLIEIQSPLANLVGFEHSPKNRQQQEALDRMKAVLNDAHRVFELTAEAKCALKTVVLDSPVFAGKPAPAKSAQKQDGHNELNAQYLFVCENPGSLKSIKVELFGLFPGMHSVRVQAINEGRQMGTGLNAQKRTLSF